MADILTREQLLEQKKKRETYLKYLKQTCAEDKIIKAAEKDLRLTVRRLERMENADYEESIESITELGGGET
ncbi:MAG: hypothetical protein J6M10_05630 [Clostridia bacterium]|nr:hypothetical protein [Clostridia bacterium]